MDSRALQKLSYGMYAVTSGKDAKCNGQIANTVFQVTSHPPTLAVAINKQNFTHEHIKDSGVFAVSILSKTTPLKYVGDLGFRCGRTVDKFEGLSFKIGKTGTRVLLDHAVAYLEAEVVKEVDAGSHTIFIGRLVDAEVLGDEEPMTYAYYHEVKRGTTPKSAPTYSPRTTEKEVENKVKYRCTVCGYVYDPEQGDASSGIPAGTPFDNLPENWVCPLCGAPKDQFEPIE
jgi:flavin reductase (DIM6/NTAB) family NADH-FMN oxidoreductase RutF/rubredoxin